MQNLVDGTIIDWLGYTGSPESGMGELYEGGVHLPWTLLPRPGRYGYAQMWKFGAAEWWRGGPDRTEHIDLSGAACAEVAGLALDANGGWTWQQHMQWLEQWGWKVTRLDLAIDLHGGGVSVAEFAECVRAGRITSRWKPKNMTEMRGIGAGVRPGHTMYLGSPESASRLVIYDKAAEQGAPLSAPAHVRVEWRTRHEVAEALAYTLATSGMQEARSGLAGYVNFHGDGGEQLPAWTRALSAAAAKPLHVVKWGGTLEGLERWIEDDVAPSLALLFDAHCGDEKWLADLIKRGREKGASKSQAVLEQLAAARRQRQQKARG